jgi:hypothetical protein
MERLGALGADAVKPLDRRVLTHRQKTFSHPVSPPRHTAQIFLQPLYHISEKKQNFYA